MAKDKDKKEKKGFLGRFFGAKKDEGAPATPSGEVEADDAATIPEAAPATPAADFTTDGATIESNELADNAATIPPGYIKAPATDTRRKGAKRPPAPAAGDGGGERTMAPSYAQGRSPATPVAGGGGDLDMTMPPGYVMKGSPQTPGRAAATDLDLTMPPGYAGADEDVGMGELTMAPSYAKPRGPGKGPPPANDLDMMTMPPGYALGGDASEMTMAPGYARPGGVSADLGDDPFARQGGEQDLILTNDPDLQPAPRVAAVDPFGFGNTDDLLGQEPAPAPPPAVAKAKRGPSDTFGFGEDVVDLLAPGPDGARGAAAPGASADPFGAPLTDDPFDGATVPAAERGAPARPAGHKTEPLEAAAGIEIFDVELDAPAPLAAASAGEGEISQEEVTLEMDRPALAASGPKGFHARPTNRLATTPGGAMAEDGVSPSQPPRRALTEVALEAVPVGPVARTLFSKSLATPEGGRRLEGKASELALDEKTGTFHAPPVSGGWSDVPTFAALLADGSVVGRLPRGATVEADGSVVLPPAPTVRSWQPDPSGQGRRANAFPAGVVLDRETRIAYASPEIAPALEGSPEPRVRTEDGGLVLFVPEGATFDESGGYTLPAATPTGSASTTGAATTDASTPAVKLGEDHPAHGELVFRASYLGCEELVYADGWGSVRLPAGAELERDAVLLPPASRAAAGAPPELLDVTRRADGWLALPIPEGFLPEGDLVWIAPASVSEPEDSADTNAGDGDDWGEPVERLTYAGIEDSLFANGWARLDLPPGASVTGQRLRIPREYAHATDAVTLAGFDREPDGTLACDLSEAAEVLGSVVLIPPEGEASAAPPPSSPGAAPVSSPGSAIRREPAASEPSPDSSGASASSAFRSAAPPDGGDTSRPGATRSLDRFRAKKGAFEPRADEVAPKPASKPDETSPGEAKPDAGAPESSKPDASSPASSPDLAPSASTADGTATDKPASETASEKPDEDGSDGSDEKAPGDGALADSPESGPIRRGKKRKKS